jgi:replication factor C subunit 3/5
LLVVCPLFAVPFSYLVPLLTEKGTPLHILGTPKIPEKDIIRDTITETTIYTCIASPHPSDIQTILAKLLNTKDVTSCLSTINTLKATQGLALADIITALAEELTKLSVPTEVMVSWLEGLAEVEYRLSGGGSEGIQTGAVVGVVRSGVQLMDGKDIKV